MGVCPLCTSPCDPRVLTLAASVDGLTPALVKLIHSLYPGWQPHHGLCPECAGRFAQHLAGLRSPDSLHTRSQPPGAFPFYHQDEATLLSQAQRLARHTGFTGAGVTIAFLDSGFYPHPDLLAEQAELPPGPRPSVRRMRQLSRLVHYVDQQDGAEREGLSQPSLWDAAGDSWHGQMTTVLAAGNGRLSGGHYAGFAPQAGILPIKIGRSRGSIPEADILRGVEWLLHRDNWQRYGVRILNVSVGGDEPMPWQENPVCLAVEELSRRGVLVVAAAGNRDQQALLAPAQAPSALTVGGVNDHNRAWRRYVPREIGQLGLYHHNWDWIEGPEGWRSKPDLVALAQWLPGPILPVSPVFGELAAADRIMEALAEGQMEAARQILAEWGEALGVERPEQAGAEQMRRAVVGLRARHKWVAPFTQHVDGTSTAAPVVAAVAAQMLQANPRLTSAELRRLLCETAMPLPHLGGEKQGAGLVQPALAVAAALRAAGGPLTGRPLSGVWLPPAQIESNELHKITIQGRVAHSSSPGDNDAPPASSQIYFGYHAPQARAVSLIGSFNRWQPGAMPLRAGADGWWHGVLALPKGAHAYRFWVETEAGGAWYPDPENGNRTASGYGLPHSVALAP